jgi:hypothetical protein
MNLPLLLSMDEQMARVWLWKGYIWCSLASLVDSSCLSLWWLTDDVWVCCAACTLSDWVLSMHTWCVCCLCVCVYQILWTWLGVDQLGRAVILSTISIWFLTCQVAMPLGITFLYCDFCAGIKHGSKWTWSSSNTRSSEDDLVKLRLGLLTCNFALFSFLLFCPFM